MSKFIPVTAKDVAVKRSNKLRDRYLCIVRMVGKREGSHHSRDTSRADIPYSCEYRIHGYDVGSLTRKEIKEMPQKAKRFRESYSIDLYVKLVKDQMLTKSSD